MIRLISVLYGFLLLSEPLAADIRVLFRFDHSGHYTHKVVQLPDSQSRGQSRESDQLQPRRKFSAQRSMSPIEAARGHFGSGPSGRSREDAGGSTFHTGHFAELLWFDPSGSLLLRNFAPDPRIARSPSHIDGTSSGHHLLTEGAWLATGPDGADYVQVLLPESSISGVGTERWVIELKRE